MADRGLDKNNNLIRERELRRFEDFLQQKSGSGQGQILYVHGISGVGKTTLLDQFSRIAEDHNIEWIVVNGKDSLYSDVLFVQNLLRTISLENGFDGLSITDALQKAVFLINEKANNSNVVFVIDSYENLMPNDLLFRLNLISKLDYRVKVVVTSTRMLPIQWRTDLYSQWRIETIEVHSFSYHEVLNLLSGHPLDLKTCNTIWKISRGHPLSLTLALSLIQSNPSITLENVKVGVIEEMSRHWYRGIPNSKLMDLISVSSLLFRFNKEILEYVLQEEISIELFHQLTGLSFCRSSKKGWYIHDLVRESVYFDFQRRSPKLYETYMERCAFYYYHLLKNSFRKQQDGFVEEFYHFYFFTGVPYIQELYFKSNEQSENYFEWMTPMMYEEVQDYIQKRKQTVTASAELIEMDGMTEEQNKTLISNEFDLIPREEFLEIGRDSIRLLRNGDRRIIGLTIVLPIHRYYDYLLQQPVIGHYLRYVSNTASDLKKGSNWFLRMFDSIIPMTEETVRTDLLKGLLSYIGPNRLLVTSIAYPGLAMVLESIGFQRIPDLIHYDFGEDFPAATYELDLRGENFYSFLDKMIQMAGYDLPRSHKHSLTNREQEIAELILTCKTNEEIAKELYISVVTVKKHIGNIFQKTGVKNRAQFIRLMLQS